MAGIGVPRSSSVVIVAVMLLGGPVASGAQIAVIAHPDSEVTELSSAELRDLFVGRAATAGDAPVVLFENRGLRERFYPVACGMGVRDVKRRWITVVLSGGGAEPPVEVEAEEVVERVAETPRSLSFVELARVDGSVRVVRIDGRSPGDAEYPLR